MHKSNSEEQPLISILIYVYRDEFLEQALESICGQTYKNIEMLIYDDCGPGRVEEICSQFENRDPRVKHIRNKINLGAERNGYKAMQGGRGDFLLILADDDYIDRTYVEKCWQELNADPTLIACCSVSHVVDKDSKIVDTMGMERLPNFDLDLPQSFEEAILRPLYMHFHGLLRRSAFEKALPYAEYIDGSDVIFIWELFLYGGFRTIEEPLFYKRDFEHSANLVASKSAMRGLKFSYLSPLTHFYPFSRRLIILIERIAQSRLDQEMRSQLLTSFSDIIHVPKHKGWIEKEIEVLIRVIRNVRKEMQSSHTDAEKNYFDMGAIRAVSEILMIAPYNESLKAIAAELT